MLCKKPYMAGAIPFGCGQCLPCRVNRRRQWMWRQFLESLCHEQNSFLTLTYDTRNIPGNWQLRPDHLRDFIREIRRVCYPIRLRYFAVGEYGEESYRPHYHISLFGMSAVSRTSIGMFADAVQRVWGKGFTSVYEFNHLTAQYVAGYVVKKLTDRRDNHEWIVPEFARMSNRPGIGAKAMEALAARLNSTYTDWADGDVPHQLQIGKRTIPLGRYLLSRLRREVGFKEELIKEIRDRKSYEKSIEMQALFTDSSPDSTFKATYLNDIEGKLRNVEARAALYKKRRTLG